MIDRRRTVAVVEPERGSQERGSAALELPILVGLLLIPFGLLVLTFSTWSERQLAARDAAGEVARHLTMTDSASGPTAEELLRQIEAGYDLAPGSLALDVDQSAIKEQRAGQSLTVRVSVVLPGPNLPLFGSLGRRTWTAEHTERMPDYGATDG